MEDVIVERTTMRSTTQNPRPKSSNAIINGDNVTVGTIIVNSPNAKVDNSKKPCGCQNSKSYEKDNEFHKDVRTFGAYLLLTLVAVGIR